MGFDPAVAQRGIASPWDALILAEAGDAGTAALVKGVIAQESEWNPNAQNPSDPSVGLMQILVGSRGPYPSYTSIQLLDPSTNLILGITFLRSLLARYSTSDDALSAYNAGHPSRLASGGYSNQAYVDSVNTYAVWYMNNDPMLTGAAPVDTTGAPTDTTSASVDTGLAVGGVVLLGLAGAIMLAARRR